MKQEWEYKKIGSFCNITTGKLDANAANENGLYPFFTCSKTPLSINTYAYDCECVLIAGNGDLNVKYYKGKFNAYQRTYILQLKKEAIGVDMRYIYAFFTLYIEDLRRKSIGGIIKYIKLGDLTNALLPLPNITTQLAIVSELDKINELIRLKKEQLKDLDKLAQNIFYEMFGDPVENNREWTIQHLGDLCDKISNGYNAKLEEDTYKSEGIMYFRCQNVWRNHFDYSDLVYIDENTNQKMRSSSLKHNDFLITKIGRINTENSSLGRVSLYEGEDDKANLSGNLCFARLKQGAAVHKFILYILISNQFRNYIRRTTVGGIDKRALNVRQISSFPIISPPLPLQHLFAQRIEQIEHQKSEVQKAITDLETLLASRMQYWFE